MPYGTDKFLLLFLFAGLQEAVDPPAEQSDLHNIACGIVVPIQDHATTRTDMGTHTQAFLDHRATLRTVLCGESWFNCDAWDIMHSSVVLHPRQELAPTGIVDTLAQ